LVSDFTFMDIRDANNIVNWNNVPIVDLSHYSDKK